MDALNYFGWLHQPTTMNDNLFDITLDNVACHTKNQHYENVNYPADPTVFPAASFYPIAEHVYSQQGEQMPSNNRFNTRNDAQPKPRFMRSPSTPAPQAQVRQNNHYQVENPQNVCVFDTHHHQQRQVHQNYIDQEDERMRAPNQYV